MTTFLFLVLPLRVSRCGAPLLMRRWVCNFLAHLLFGLAKAVTLGFRSRRTHEYILLSQLRLSQPGGPVPVFISPRSRVTQLYTQGTGFPFVVKDTVVVFYLSIFIQQPVTSVTTLSLTHTINNPKKNFFTPYVCFYITLGQTQYKKPCIYISVSMITMRTPRAFQTLLLGLLLNFQQSSLELGLN
jgi:hypothetical protein